jgi:hypothetical protein
MMRKNCGFYSEILDMYAPAIVSAKVWNNEAYMKAYCGTDDPKEFSNHVLTLSDEAFLLLVLINYSANWYSEIQKKQRRYVWGVDCHYAIIARLSSNCTNIYQANNMWTAEHEREHVVSD